MLLMPRVTLHDLVLAIIIGAEFIDSESAALPKHFKSAVRHDSVFVFNP